jgi:hypothetical protein
MRDITDDGDAQTFEAAPAIDDSECIEQCLRRMFMRAVAGVYEWDRQIAGKEMRCTRRGMPHHNRVRPHRA